MNEALTDCECSPCNCDERYPIRRADSLDQDIAWELEDDVADEEEEEGDGGSIADVEAEILV